MAADKCAFQKKLRTSVICSSHYRRSGAGSVLYHTCMQRFHACMCALEVQMHVSTCRRMVARCPVYCQHFALISLCDPGLGGGLVLSLIWMLVLRLFCGVMVWVTIWMANLCFIACTIFSYAKAGDVSATSKLGHVSHALRLDCRAQSQATCK